MLTQDELMKSTGKWSISKYPKRKFEVEDIFSRFWKCPFKNPPKDKQRIFGIATWCHLMLDENRNINPQEKENAVPFIQLYEVKIHPLDSVMYYLIVQEDGTIDSDPYEATLDPSYYKVIAYIDEKEYWDSLIHINTYHEWIFVKEVEGTYEQALKEAGRLQEGDPTFDYRIWDQRGPDQSEEDSEKMT